MASSAEDFGIDPLTGALSPTRFNEILEREILLNKRTKSLIQVVTIEISYTQDEVIDSEIIDEALIKLVYELKQILRQTDCICRINQTGLWLLLVNSESSHTFQNSSSQAFQSLQDSRSSQSAQHSASQQKSTEINNTSKILERIQTKGLKVLTEMKLDKSNPLKISNIFYHGEGFLDFLLSIDRTYFSD
jgi:GGDEF domain-containing protein